MKGDTIMKKITEWLAAALGAAAYDGAYITKEG